MWAPGAVEPFYVFRAGKVPGLSTAVGVFLSKFAWLSTGKLRFAYAVLDGLVVATWGGVGYAAGADAISGGLLVDFGHTGCHADGHWAFALGGDNLFEESTHVFAKGSCGFYWFS